MKKVLQIEYSQSILVSGCKVLESEGFVVDSLLRSASENRIEIE